MKLKVRIDFNDNERVYVLEMASELNMKVDEFCRRAVLYAINDAYRRAEEEAAKQGVDNGTHDTVPTESSGDTEQQQQNQDANSNALSQP